jgi:hypothetical protein
MVPKLLFLFGQPFIIPKILLSVLLAHKAGPLSVLRMCVEQHLKVKVWTRNYKHARGICNGYIVAFDKHWNLVNICRDIHYCSSQFWLHDLLLCHFIHFLF